MLISYNIKEGIQNSISYHHLNPVLRNNLVIFLNDKDKNFNVHHLSNLILYIFVEMNNIKDLYDDVQDMLLLDKSYHLIVQDDILKRGLINELSLHENNKHIEELLNKYVTKKLFINVIVFLKIANKIYNYRYKLDNIDYKSKDKNVEDIKIMFSTINKVLEINKN